jgi:heme a synthase
VTDQTDGRIQLNTIDRPLRFLAVSAAFATFVLLVLGSLVTATESGDSVPDWPFAFGSLVPLNRLAGKVVFEYTHRVVAVITGLLILALTVMVLARDRRRWVKAVTLSALAAVAVQAGLGGARVMLGDAHGEVVAAIHALLAQIVFAFTILIVAVQHRGFRGLDAQGDGPEWLARPSVILADVSVAAILVQVFLGAAFRHGFLNVFVHIVFGIVVALLLGAVAGIVSARAMKQRKAGLGPEGALQAARLVEAPARWAQWVLLIQLALGVAAYLLLRAEPVSAQQESAINIIITSSHLAVGALLLAATVAMTARMHAAHRNRAAA